MIQKIKDLFTVYSPNSSWKIQLGCVDVFLVDIFIPYGIIQLYYYFRSLILIYTKFELKYIEWDLIQIDYNDMPEDTDKNYLWSKLEKSIKKHSVISPVLLRKLPKGHRATKDWTKNPPLENVYKYDIVDGFHRLAIMNKLYGPEYKVKCRVIEYDKYSSRELSKILHVRRCS
jgi:hypothetical protein